MSLIATPSLDPAARRAAIDALEAQRAAYHRYARQMEAERAALGVGDGDRATRAAEAAVRGFGELQDGTQRLAPLVDGIVRGGDAATAREVERHMDQLLAEARAAEAAIQNLALQLEAWRDAYGRQLAEAGLPPGGADGRGAGELRPAPYGEGGGHAARAPHATRVTLLDRRG
jgi:multidrug resistance efflux pump